MALSNAERQRRHRERQKQKLAAAAPDLSMQHDNVGADLRDKLYALIDAENARRERTVTPVGPTDFRRVILDIALNENRSGIADSARMVLLKALCMGESSEKEILDARRQKDAFAERKPDLRDSKEQVTPLAHYLRVPNFG
jgi:hypothetical protein